MAKNPFGADQNLKYSIEADYENTIESLKTSMLNDLNLPVQDVEKKRNFPTELEMAMLSSAAYENEDVLSSRTDILPQGWKLLTSATSSGYVGYLFWNPEDQLVVLAHRGTDSVKHIISCIMGVILNTFDTQIYSAITFADTINKVIETINNENHISSVNIVLSCTGHSLGGWLAQITAFSSKYLDRVENHFEFENKGLQVHTVSFDSPGCKDMLKKLKECITDLRYSKVISVSSLDITCILSAPNFVNCFREHTGRILRECGDIPSTWHLELPGFYTKCVHTIKNFVLALESGKELVHVVDWPLMKVNKYKEFFNFFKIGKSSNNYHPQQKIITDSGHTVRYAFKPIDKTECRLNIFSESESRFVTWVCALKEKEENIEEISKFPKFKIELVSGSLVIKCEDSIANALENIVKPVKNLFRWNSGQIEVIKNKVKNIPSLDEWLLCYESKLYKEKLCKLEINFPDFMQLEEFLNSDTQNIFNLSCGIDANFSVAVMLTIINALPNSDSHEKFIILSWNSFNKLKEDLTFIGYNFNGLRNFPVVIIDFSKENAATEENVITEKNISEIIQNGMTKLIAITTKETSTSLVDVLNNFQKQLAKFTIELSSFYHLNIDFRRDLFLKKLFLDCRNGTISLEDIIEFDEDTISTTLDNLQDHLDEKYIIDILTNSAELNKRCFRENSATLDVCYMKVQTHGIITKKQFFEKTNDGKQERTKNETTEGTSPLYFVTSSSGNNPFEKNSSVIYSSCKDNEAQYEEFKYSCNKNPSVGAYWYDYVTNEDHFHLQCIYNPKLSVRRYLLPDDCTTYLCTRPCPKDHIQPINEEKFTENTSDRLVIFAGEPASGKSALLAKLSTLVNSDIVIKLNLGSCQNSLEKFSLNCQQAAAREAPARTENQKLELNEAVEFIFKNCTSGPVSYKNGHRLLKFIITHNSKKPIYLILDEFDEVRDVNHDGRLLDTVILLVRELLRNTKINIWIGVRKHLQAKLKDNFTQAISISLQEIDLNDMEGFISSYWESLAIVDSTNEYNTFEADSKTLIRKAAEFFTNRYGSPLIMKLLAVVFYLKMEDLNNVNTNNFRFGTLIKSFIDLKFDIYINEKLGCIVKHNSSNDIPWYKDALTQKHEYLATKCVFPEWYTNLFNDIQIPTSADIVEYLRIGIVETFRPTETPRFIHQIFEEYYCASLFVKRLSTGNDNIKQLVLRYMMTRILILPSYKTIRSVIDDKIGDSFHKPEVYKTFSNWIMILWERQQNTFYNTDHDTALHFVVTENLENLAKFLINSVLYSTKGPIYGLMSCRNNRGETSFNIALRSPNHTIQNLYVKKLIECSSEVTHDILLSSFFKIPNNELSPQLQKLKEILTVEECLQCLKIIGNIEKNQKSIETVFEIIKSGDVTEMWNTFQNIGSEEFSEQYQKEFSEQYQKQFSKQYRHYLARTCDEEDRFLISVAMDNVNWLPMVNYLISEYTILINSKVPKYEGDSNFISLLLHTIAALTKTTRIKELEDLAKKLGKAKGCNENVWSMNHLPSFQRQSSKSVKKSKISTRNRQNDTDVVEMDDIILPEWIFNKK